jgi:hypothetical protein
MGAFVDDYGVRPWVMVTAVVTAVLVVVGGLIGGLYAAGAFSAPPSTAQVQYKDTEWVNDALIYYLVFANGQQQRVTYGAWQGAQPGYSYAPLPGTSTGNVADEDAEDPDITDPDTQYEISDGEVSTAASTSQVSVPDDDEDFTVSDDDG